jgi:aminopeptidase YwaD
MPGILVAINIDDVGFKKGKSSYSFYECSPGFEEKVENEFRIFEGLNRGEQWINGDHMIFVQNQVPSIAITSEFTPELMKIVTHTSADTPDLIDCHKLVEIAMALNDVVRTL